MSLMWLILLIVVVGLIWYLVPGIPPALQRVLIAIVVVACIVWLLGVFGVLAAGDIRVR